MFIHHVQYCTPGRHTCVKRHYDEHVVGSGDCPHKTCGSREIGVNVYINAADYHVNQARSLGKLLCYAGAEQI